ncbi:MAG: HEAT repeat domain-containing protein [Deltaproteobacteria bacterium]|nr:HEAT repeat domain-containing protein [Deltaproteobacteria bacterium]MDQ3296226.1 HEAT repeat domain-containing protein [Myxococcota bacterium]
MTVSRTFTLTTAEQARVEHIDQLVALGPSGVDELISTMSDPSWTVRRASVAALASLGDDSVGPLCTWLSDQRTEEHSIAAAVDALAASIGKSTTVAVMAMLADPRPAIAADAAQILGRRRATEACAILGKAISHVDDNVAVAAIEALGAIGGSAAIDELIAVMGHRNFFRTFPALQVLAKSGDPRAVAPLASLLDDETFCFEAVRALGRTGSAQAIPPLASLLPRSGDAIVRLIALALADLVTRAEWIGVAAQVVITMRECIGPSLVRFAAALRASDPEERAALAVVLGRIGDESVIPELARLLDDPELHTIATEAIQRIGELHDAAQIAALAVDAATRVAVLPIVNSRAAAASVRALLRDENGEVRARACEALARIGDSASVPQLFATLDDPNPRVALAATAAIQSLGVADTAKRVIAALQHGSPAVRRYALRIIAYMGFAEAYEPVSLAISDADPRIAELAVASLGAINDPRVDGLLAEIAVSPTPTLRAAAMRAAVNRLGENAGELLERGLADDFAWVRYYACQGLGRIGRANAVEQLIARLADATPHVRISAIEALAHLETAAAWQALCSVIRSGDPDERRAALISVGLRPGDAALPFLFEALKSTDVATRLIGLSGLARRPEDSALEHVAVAALDPVAEVRDAALSLLGERWDRAAAEALVDLALACDEEHPVHLTLSRPGACRIAAIAARLANVDDRRAPILASALARMHEGSATTTLFEALTLTNAAARRAAATTLIAMAVDGAYKAVTRVAREDPDLEVRRVCAALVAA